MSELVSQHCEACRRDAPHATEAAIAEYLPQIPDWETLEEDGIKRLQPVSRFSNLAASPAFPLFRRAAGGWCIGL